MRILSHEQTKRKLSEEFMNTKVKIEITAAELLAYAGMLSNTDSNAMAAGIFSAVNEMDSDELSSHFKRGTGQVTDTIAFVLGEELEGNKKLLHSYFKSLV